MYSCGKYCELVQQFLAKIAFCESLYHVNKQMQSSGVCSKLVFSSSIKKLTCVKNRFCHLLWLRKHDVLANYVVFFFGIGHNYGYLI